MQRAIDTSRQCHNSKARILTTTNLAKVELSILLVGNALNLYQRCVGAGVALGPLVAQDTTFAVQPANQR